MYRPEVPDNLAESTRMKPHEPFHQEGESKLKRIYRSVFRDQERMYVTRAIWQQHTVQPPTTLSLLSPAAVPCLGRIQALIGILGFNEAKTIDPEHWTNSDGDSLAMESTE